MEEHQRVSLRVVILFIPNTPDIQLVLVYLQRSLKFLCLSSLQARGASKKCKMVHARWKMHPVQREGRRPFIFVNTFIPRAIKEVKYSPAEP